MIAIIGAMDVEVNKLLKNMEIESENKIGVFTFYKGKIDNKEVVLLKSGIGKVSSAVGAAILINIYKPDLIINTGIAGGVGPLKSEDIVLAKTLSYKDVDVTVFGYEYGQVPGMPHLFNSDEKYLKLVSDCFDKNNIEYKYGHAITGDSFTVTLNDYKGKIYDNMICEMEGASIAQACYILKTPFVSIRYISDIIDAPSQIKDYEQFERHMASRSCDLLIDIIKQL